MNDIALGYGREPRVVQRVEMVKGQLVLRMSSTALSLAPAAPLEAERAEAAEAFLILSIDVEEHCRIESAVGLAVSAAAQAEYARRMEASTRWLLEQLAATRQKATFFILGEIACTHPRLVRDIHDAGHEIASHGWNHRRLHLLTPAAFGDDLRQSRDALEQAAGAPVYGYRAPTFSVGRKTAWAIDVLAEQGFHYDSSIYPVRHDRYGMREAPRAPFRVAGERCEMLELPPVTLRVGNARIPVGGGGYFRLFPARVMRSGIAQTIRECVPPVGMLYFHPWEFDPDQPRLNLSLLNRLRTYTGMRRTRARLQDLLSGYRFTRAIDVADRLTPTLPRLPSFRLAPPETAQSG